MHSALLCLFLIFAAEATFDFTTIGKKCIVDIGSTEEKIGSLFLKDTVVILTEGDKVLYEKFVICCMKDFVSDTHLVVDDKLINYITDVIITRIHGRRKLAHLIAKDCVDHCKDITDTTKDKMIVKAHKCIIDRFVELV